MISGKIIKVSGPLIVAEGLAGAKMYDVVRVGEHKLIGEIIELRGDLASIQVYEETGGIGPGEPVVSTETPLSVELGPGLIESIYDGIQRPLDIIKSVAGDYITRGISIPSLARDKKWAFMPLKKKGDAVKAGDIIGEVAETEVVKHRILVPPGVSGILSDIKNGSFTVEETVAVITDTNREIKIPMMQTWPVRKPRPYGEKLSPVVPLSTGQRVIDAFFPVAKGGTACVPGPFGSGKTVIQHQLAKWADADIIVYIGCGERGNEMTDVLLEFPELKDPKTGYPLMKRTVLIANTSNMPVAAREASIYTGITIAEYFRDMGYSVAVMADSTSRWAEALREMSGRLEEMPGEEGYPAYLGTKLAEFYERAGRVICLGTDKREGALSVIGAVSPPGGDLSDPVVQSTLRVVKVFWSLEDKLAYRRHFPAINWLTSYSLYIDNLRGYMEKIIGPEWMECRNRSMKLLEEESELEEIVRLVGVDALSPEDRLILETTKSIREDFLHQNAFMDEDTYTPYEKQYWLLKIILAYYDASLLALKSSVAPEKLFTHPVREKIAKAKYISFDDKEAFSNMYEEVKNAINALSSEIGG